MIVIFHILLLVQLRAGEFVSYCSYKVSGQNYLIDVFVDLSLVLIPWKRLTIQKKKRGTSENRVGRLDRL
jgi:hypothetical protein